MKESKIIPILLLFGLLPMVSGCHEDEALEANDSFVISTDTLNIDVVLPSDIRSQWQNAIDWALENIDKSQQQCHDRVSLRLRYHDEDTEDLDELAYNLTHPEAGDDTCHAIIGPYHSDNAQTFLSHAAQTRLPVVMPTCTSADLQRIHARSTYAWFLTESDITQCEVMLIAAHALGASDVMLVYEDNTYGRSFYDWFGYYATELGLHVPDEWALAYQEGADLKPFLTKADADVSGEHAVVIVAISDAENYEDIIDQITSFTWLWALENRNYVKYTTICADTSLDEFVINPNHFSSFDYGVSPYGHMHYGFPQNYMERYGREALNGEAQIYDALMIIAMGAAKRKANPATCLVDGHPAVSDTEQPQLTDYMRSVVSSKDGMTIHWNLQSMASAFRELEAGRNIDLSGASGNLFFDQTAHTQILNTSYLLWTLDWAWSDEDDGWLASLLPLLYLSSGDSGLEVDATALWKAEKQFSQTFSKDVESHELPPVTDRWAVVVSPSTTWNNYRHQADAFAMYQLLREHGYDDDHIILIVEDNLANDAHNKYPGKIYIESPAATGDESSGTTGATDVRKDAVIDYHFSQLRPEDLADIMLGRQSERLPHVIHPTATSDVFFFWSGHGGPSEGPLWGNENTREYFGTERIKNIVSQMNDADMYRRMMLAIETCYSGLWGEALTGQPDVLVLTAANGKETSKADVFDHQLGVYLSNAFARTFRSHVSTSPGISLYDLYLELFRTTNGSHVTIYNNDKYGSVYTETMHDFFP